MIKVKTALNALPVGWSSALVSSRNTIGVRAHTSKRLSGFKVAKLSDFDTRRGGLYRAVR